MTVVYGEKLEVGAGYRPTPGYIHQDIRPGDHIEIVCDLREIDSFVGQGWAEIRATHVMEHFSPAEGLEIMRKVHELLLTGGIFYIEVPNFAWQTKAHAAGEISDMQAVYYVYGEQDYPENTHKNGYTMETIAKDLTEAGFAASVKDIGQVLIAVGQKL